MKIIQVLTLCGIVLTAGAGACAAQEKTSAPSTAESAAASKVNREDTIALARAYAQAERQTVVAVNLQLTQEESSSFWPVYNEYQNALEPLRDRMAKLIVFYIEKFDTLTDADAKSMLEELLSVQEKEGQVRRKFMKKFEAILPIKKVARFYQIDNKINAEIRYQLSLEIPLLETTTAK